MFGQRKTVTEGAKEHSVKPYVSPFAKTPEERAEAKRAEQEWREACKKAVDELSASNTEPAYKIKQSAEGPFVILKKAIYSADYSSWFATGMLVDVWKADHYADKSTEAYLSFDAIQDWRAPIRSYDGKGISGYEPVKFNTREEAEAYLARLTKPEEYETAYDKDGKPL